MAGGKYEIPDEFLEAADRFVSLANELGENVSRDWVRAVMMYATARYNAFTWITRDDGHGLRGGNLARSLRGTLVHLDDARFELLFEACRLHTDGLTEGEPTLQACWDADRLDLGRVGITPEPHRLCTDAARGLVSWANARALVNHRPAEVLASWGLG